MHTMLRNMMLGATALALTASMVGAATTANAQTSAPTVAPAPASPAAIPGSRVKALQEALSEQGMTVTADGVLDEETRAAIRKYQSQHHLPVTGEPDQATLDKLGVAAGNARGQRMGSAGMCQGGMGQGGAMGQGCPMMGQGMMGQGTMGQGMPRSRRRDGTRRRRHARPAHDAFHVRPDGRGRRRSALTAGVSGGA